MSQRDDSMSQCDWAHGHEGAVSRGELTDETRGAIARMSPEQAWHKIYSVAGRVDRQGPPTSIARGDRARTARRQ